MMRRAEKGDRVVESGEHPGEQRKHRLKRTRALEGEEAGDHHDGLESAKQPILGVVFVPSSFAFLTCSHIGRGLF